MSGFLSSRTRLRPASRIAGLALLLLAAGAGCRSEREADPEARLAAGWERFAQGDFATALADFTAVHESLSPGSPLRPGTLYALATVWNLRRPDQNAVRAERYYRQAIEAAPGSDWDAWSRLALARMPLSAPGAAVKPPDPAELEAAYKEVEARFPFHEAGEQAFLFRQAMLLEAPRPEARAALEALEGFLQTHPETPYKAAAWKLIGHASLLLGRPGAVVEAAEQEWRTAEVDPLNPGQELAGTYWKLATLAEFEAGDFETARTYYRKLIEEYPRDQRVFVAKQELRKMDELEARLRADLAGEGRP